jgi:hypothetical protein
MDFLEKKYIEIQRRTYERLAIIGLGPCAFDGLTTDEAVILIRFSILQTKAKHHPDYAASGGTGKGAKELNMIEHFNRNGDDFKKFVVELKNHSKALAANLNNSTSFMVEPICGFYLSGKEIHDTLVRVGFFPYFYRAMSAEATSEWFKAIVKKMLHLQNPMGNKDNRRIRHLSKLLNLVREHTPCDFVDKLKHEAGFQEETVVVPKRIEYHVDLKHQLSNVLIKNRRSKKRSRKK